MRWLQFLGIGGRRKTPFNNVDASGNLTAGRVTDHLLLGGELGPRDWPALRDAGVTAIVNLQQEQQDSFAHDEKIDAYLWLPAPDGRAMTLKQLAQGVTFLRAAIGSGQRVFVHCKAGQGRAPLLCACYLIAEGYSALDASRIVSQSRPATQLTAEQSARLREFSAHFGSEQEETPLTPTSTMATRRALNARNAGNVESENGAGDKIAGESASALQSPVKLNAASRTSHKRRR